MYVLLKWCNNYCTLLIFISPPNYIFTFENLATHFNMFLSTYHICLWVKVDKKNGFSKFNNFLEHSYHHFCGRFYVLCTFLFSCFDKPTMEDIISALEQDGTEWALQQIEVPKWRTGYIFTSYQFPYVCPISQCFCSMGYDKVYMHAIVTVVDLRLSGWSKGIYVVWFTIFFISNASITL